MRVLAAQLNPTIGALKANCAKIISTIEQGIKEKYDLILFPELALTGYPPEDLLLQESFVNEVERYLNDIVDATQNIMVIVGTPRRNPTGEGKLLYNSAAVIQNQKIIGYYDKWLLPTYDVFDERRYFEPGLNKGVWECAGKKFGLIICEDMWQHAGIVGNTRYKRDPIVALIDEDIDFLINISASPYEFHKKDLRVKVCEKAASTLKCPVIYCCQVGGNDELVFDGYSMWVDTDGKLKRLAKGFEEDLIEINLENPPPSRTFSYDPFHDLYFALVLGVRDYFYKQGFTKACFGLSGGIDSALVACIVTDALGPENVLGISMPSRFTSKLSESDAEALAKNLGIEFKTIPIEEPFNAFLDLLGPHFEGKGEDVTEENLQPRIRGSILMAISNKLGYIVTSTGNKSEFALGYCTLYGDMCGGLGVISDVIKTHVYELSRWINEQSERIPPSTIEREPTAELRADQKDTDTLPDYEKVDLVLTAYVEDYLSPDEIADKYSLDIGLVNDLVRRIHMAEYKRRQGSPGIRVSKKSFQVGRYYPIVQGWR